MSPSKPSASPASDIFFDPEAALHALDDGYCAVAPDWRIAFVNAAFARLLGAPGPERVGRDLWECFPSLNGGSYAELMRKSMRDGRTRSFRIVCRDGTLRGREGAEYDVKVTGMPEGGICVQCRDVSEAIRFERELAQRSEENVSLREVARALAEEVDLAALLRLICNEAASQCGAQGATVTEVSESGAHVVAATGIVAEARGHWFELAGSLTERAVAGRAPVATEDCGAEFPGSVEDIAAFGAIGPALMVPLLAHNQVLGVLMVGRPRGGVPFTEGEMRRIRAIADHAALAVWTSRLLKQVQEANRTKSEFMATISHELRTPLTTLTGYEELLADEVLGPLTEPQVSAIERMRSSTEFLTMIIEEILSFSRLEAGQEQVRPRETTAEAILKATAAVLEPLAQDKGLELTLLAPSGSVPLFTDSEMIRRILINLAANAVKFTAQGSVEIKAAADADDVWFAVRDTGIGIAPDDLARLFQPFTQLESGFTRRYGGTGLGLFISKRLAWLLGGRIDVESEPGRGSTFTLVIPARHGTEEKRE